MIDTHISSPKGIWLSKSFAKKTNHAFHVKTSRDAKRRSLARFLESKLFSFWILIPTLYILFTHDIISSSGAPWTKTLSITIGALDLFIFIAFFVEICCNFYAYRRSYYLSVLFILDLIALVTLVPDMLQNLFQVQVAADQLTIARAARVARIATRLARLPKLIEILSCNDKRRDMVAGNEPSAIAKRLEQKISTKLVISMLLLLTISSLCYQSLDVQPHAELALRELETVAINTNFSGLLFNDTLNLYITYNQVMRLRISDVTILSNDATIERTQDIYELQVQTEKSYSLLLVKQEQQEAYALRIVQTVCTIIILCCACVFIARDLLVLVIHPVERMLLLIRKLTSTATYSDMSHNLEQSYDDDGDEGAPNSARSNRQPDYLTEGSIDESDSLETNILVEFVDILTHEHMEQDAQRKMEHQRTKMIHTFGAAIQGWLARRNYSKTNEIYYRREQVATEILNTERSFVTSLQIIVAVFLIPLREADILDEYVINSIFLGSETILNYNRDLLTKIEKQFEPQWTVRSALGSIFQSMEDMVSLYSGFVNNCTNAAELLTKYKESNTKFASFIEEQESHTACNNLNLSSYLIMPVQRVPRYILLLEQLAKFTPPDHSDYSPLMDAIEVIKRATNSINERKRETENRTAIHNIYIKLEPEVDLLMSHHCTFIMEGQLTHEGETFYFYLFNCVLLKCVPKDGGTRMQVVDETEISAKCAVTPIVDSPHFGIRNAFQFEPDNNFCKLLLSAPNPTCQFDWIDNLSQCIQKCSTGPKRERYSVAPPVNMAQPANRTLKMQKRMTTNSTTQKLRRKIGTMGRLGTISKQPSTSEKLV